MPEQSTEDYYDVLQISTNAEPETINRVYRMLAQRYHPDNLQSGNESRFRIITEAYAVLSDPEKRAKYDVAHQKQRDDRWRLIASGAQTENDFEMEQIVRLSVLEALYTRRRLEPSNPGIPFREFEKMTSRPREHLEFTFGFSRRRSLWSSMTNHVCV